MYLRSILILIALACMAQGAIVYSVSLETSLLIGHPAGPFYFAVQLADGSGTSDGNNAAVLSGFTFGVGGGIAGPPFTLGMASGDMVSTVVLTDGSPVNYFYQRFLPGDRLSFNLTLTTNLDPDLPDGLAFYLLDSSLTPLPTMAGQGFDAWLYFDIDSDSPVPHVFEGDGGRTPWAGGPPIPFPAATVVPEPGVFVPMCLVCGALIWLRRKR